MYLGDEMVIKIDHQDWLGRTSIYLAMRTPDGMKLARPIELVFEPIEEGAVAEPTLRMDSGYARELFKALAEALDSEGIKTLKDANLEGVLEATRYHLGDMRLLAGVVAPPSIVRTQKHDEP